MTHTSMILRVLTLTGLFLPIAASKASAPPNVIVVMTDDQGYGEFSCNGNPITATPNIDRLAQEGIRLTDFHVSPMCTPTRGQLMTGLDAFRNGAINVSSGRTLMRPELKTMADVFKAAGYRTGIFGKWHLGDNYPFRPEDRGFDQAIWFPSSHINSVPDFWDNDYFDDTYIHNGKRETFDGYCTDVFFQEGMRWMKTGGDKPFFAYIALNSAHWPWFVPNHYRDAIRKSMSDHPGVVGHLPSEKRENLVSFLAMGANIDDNFGKLESFLVETGLKGNTIVVFLTDNGSTMGQDYFNAGMRGKKTQLWEGGHRVPCLIRWPAGDIGDPRDISELSQVQDLLPTLADMCGVTQYMPKQLDGESLAPIFRGEKQTLGDRMLVINYSRMPGFNVGYTKGNPAIPQRDGAAVLWKQWRLLENRRLYNVKVDPHQDRDVAAEHPEIVSKLREHLELWWDSVKDHVLKPKRVVIGSIVENPMLLTACEWLDVFVDQQVQIRRGVNKNGVWHLTVAESGRYEFELRRWPRESRLKLRDGCRRTPVVDGVYVRGKALPIAKGRLRIAQFDEATTPTEDEQAIRFTTSLTRGDVDLQTWMLDENGAEVCGAYYVYVRRK